VRTFGEKFSGLFEGSPPYINPFGASPQNFLKGFYTLTPQIVNPSNRGFGPYLDWGKKLKKSPL